MNEGLICLYIKNDALRCWNTASYQKAEEIDYYTLHYKETLSFYVDKSPPFGTKEIKHSDSTATTVHNMILLTLQ